MVATGSGSATSDNDTIAVTVNAVNDDPSSISVVGGGSLAINENSVNGTVVGTVVGQDPDAGDNLTYALVDDAGGRFAINSAGQVSVADGLLLDFEQASAHVVTVRVSDQDGRTFNQAFAINVNDVNPETVFGDSRDNIINGGALNDFLAGDTGIDTLRGGDGDDGLFGGAGNDVLDGGMGTDTVVFFTSSAEVTVNLAGGWGSGSQTGNDSITEVENVITGSADDVVVGNVGSNAFLLGSGNDRANSGDGADSLSGEAGNDELGGGAGNDILVGGDGNDTIFGESGNDTANGGFGSDIIIGGDGADQLGGGDDEDIIAGGAGNDTLWGETGVDTLDGGTGNDILLGGTGGDHFNFGLSSGSDLIVDFNFQEGDRLALFGQSAVIGHDEFDNVILNFSGGGSVTLSGVHEFTPDFFI